MAGRPLASPPWAGDKRNRQAKDQDQRKKKPSLDHSPNPFLHHLASLTGTRASFEVLYTAPPFSNLQFEVRESAIREFKEEIDGMSQKIGPILFLLSSAMRRSVSDVGRLRIYLTAGCCCVRQWNVPRPQINSRQSMPITRRSGKHSRRMDNAASSFGSGNVGTSTHVFAI